MIFNLRKILLLCLCVAPFYTFSQESDLSLVRKYAETAFNKGDYEFALENYKILYESTPDDIDINFCIGACYTETNIDKEAAVKYLEFVARHNNFPARTYYYLGRSYMNTYRFTEAIEAFYNYKMYGSIESELHESTRMIEMCEKAVEVIPNAQNVKFTLLDTTINSTADDMLPFITNYGTLLYFTSTREYNKELEEYQSLGFYSELKKGAWTNAISVPPHNNDYEEIVGVSPDGNHLFIHANGDFASHDIRKTNRKGNKFSRALPAELPSFINTEGVECGASMTADGNTLFFASNKKGGYGGMDIYVVRRELDGSWGEPQNLGPTINSPYDDNYPNISADGKEIYFASKGHDGIGGYDIFTSSMLDDGRTWTNPRPLDYPINTPLDDISISFAPDRRSAYLAAKRKEGIGGLDIYRVEFFEEQAIALAFTIYVGNNESDAVRYSIDHPKAYCVINDIYGNIFAQVEVTEDGEAFIMLPPGEYRLEARFEGYEPSSKTKIVVSENAVGEAGILYQDIYLKPLN